MSTRYLILAGLLSLTVVACAPEKGSESVTDKSMSNTPTDKPTQKVEAEQVLDNETQEAVANLQWVHQFNVEREIEQALSNEDFRLFVVAGRGANAPGIAAEKQESLKKLCGQKHIEGVGDQLLGKAHEKLYSEAIRLTSKYNLAMAENCEEASK